MLKTLIKSLASPPASTPPADVPPTAAGAAPAAPAPLQPPAHHPYFGHVMQRFFASLASVQADNIDRERFSVPPGGQMAMNTASHYEYFAFFQAHAERFAHARAVFEDEASRSLYDDLVLYRLLGHTYVRLPPNNPRHWALREQTLGYRLPEPSGYSSRIFGSMAHFGVPFMGENIRVECWPYNAAWAFLLKQYYFDRDGVVIGPRAGDRLIDAGACFGETALGFAAAVGDAGRVYAFEMMPDNLGLIRSNLEANPSLAKRVDVVESALGEHSGAALYIHGAGPSAHLSEAPSEQRAPVISLDDFVARNAVPRVDFIKLDIEGAEGQALRGAAKTLARWRPRLAVSLYHRPADLFELPLYLASLDLDYAFYLDHYTIHTEETVLYAMPRS